MLKNTRMADIRAAAVSRADIECLNKSPQLCYPYLTDEDMAAVQ